MAGGSLSCHTANSLGMPGLSIQLGAPWGMVVPGILKLLPHYSLVKGG